MNKSTAFSFNSLMFLAFALCTNIAVTPPPAMAETCMTQDLMMVYEPVEAVQPRPKKSKGKFAVASHKAKGHNNSQLYAHASKSVAVKQQLTVKEQVSAKQQLASKQQLAVKQSPNKTNANESDSYVETKSHDLSLKKPVVSSST